MTWDAAFDLALDYAPHALAVAGCLGVILIGHLPGAGGTGAAA